MEDYGLVSVIIPVYNAEQYLSKSVSSVLKQTYQHFEILLIDDGSTDQSPKMCDEYAAQLDNVHAFHKQNGGASTARNVGLENAKGEYIFFLDSDDWLESNALEMMITTAKKENVDLVFCEAKAIDDDGNIELNGHYTYKEHYSTDNAYQIMLKMMESKEFHVAIWMLLLDRRIITDNQLRFKEGIIYEDLIISYQLYCLSSRAAHVRQKLYNRRYRPNSVMTSKKTEKNYISAATVYWEVERFNKTLPDKKQSCMHLIRCSFHVIGIYRQMPWRIKRKYRNDFQLIIQDILDKDAYGDKALKLDCKSHFLWGAYKLKQKILK